MASSFLKSFLLYRILSYHKSQLGYVCSLAVLARSLVVRTVLPQLSSAYQYISDKIFSGELVENDKKKKKKMDLEGMMLSEKVK